MKLRTFRFLAPIVVLLIAGAGAAAAQPAQPDAAPQTPALGDTIPAFDAQRIDGSMQHVAFPKGQSTVLLFFLSGCPTCHKMIPEWNRSYERRPAGLTVIGVIMDQEPLGFFDAMHVSFPVVRSPGREFLKSLKVNRAPVTLRVAPGGKVDDVALGLVDPIRLGELFKK
jgi:peroxiredoxin